MTSVQICGIKFAIYDVRESATTVNDPDGSIIKYHIKHFQSLYFDNVVVGRTVMRLLVIHNYAN